MMGNGFPRKFSDVVRRLQGTDLEWEIYDCTSLNSEYQHLQT